MVRSHRGTSVQQTLCSGCQKLETHLIREWRNSFASDPSFNEAKECRIHDSYQQLEAGARNGCSACRAFRRSLLEMQYTSKASSELLASHGPVDAILSKRMDPKGHDFRLKIRVTVTSAGGSKEQRTAHFVCTDHEETISRRVPRNLPTVSEDHAILRQLQHWLQDCHNNHEDCSNMRWSTKNPTNLIEILSSTEIRLIKPPKEPLLKYSALSYSWGKRDQLSVDDVTKIEHAKTRRRADSHGWRPNIAARRRKFHITDLPETMRDAIRLSRRLEIPYIWVDQVCIGDAEDWNKEASKMHEVYGNAHVTICACSTEKATVGLFDRRKAWEYPEEPCTLEGLRLLEFDLSLKEVRLHAPIFTRAWILQEERLSPRTIYWCSQRAFWSCNKSFRSEMVVPGNLAGGVMHDPYERNLGTKTLGSPQEFMWSRWKGNTQKLHQDWLDLVQDFTKRSIFDAADIFPAMSGLAAQYLQAFTHDDQVTNRQEYLAGLWRESFAEDLTWVVKTARNPYYRHSNAPRWSWASLPSETSIKTRNHFESCTHFKLLEPSKIKSKDGVFEVVTRGAEIQAVRVKGRLRKFAPTVSEVVEWHDILQTSADGPKFRFDGYGSDSIVARHLEQGKILSYECNKEEVVAQLDYSEDYGDMQDLYCLEVGKASMLILIRATRSKSRGIPSFIRIGAGHGYRPNFFYDNVPVQELDLVAHMQPENPGWLCEFYLVLQWFAALLKTLLML